MFGAGAGGMTKGRTLSEQFFTKQLPNGLTLLGQRMEQVSSASLALMVPAGSAYDPAGAEGAAAVAAEWCVRGAGPYDTRQLNDALDALGSQHDENVQSEHVSFSAAQLGRNLEKVLEILGEVILHPHLDERGFMPSKGLILQDLASLEDEPARKCNMLLRERFYPMPLGRCVYGKSETLAAMQCDDVRRHVRRTFTPHQSILAVAGNVDWNAFCDAAERVFGQWQSQTVPAIQPAAPTGGIEHVAKDSAQVHIAFACPSVTLSDGRYYAARVAVTVLSGGMSSRLFTEVREKRGLVYHVSTRYHSLKDHAGLFTYAASVPAKAHETLQVTVGELRRLGEGVEEDEMARARTQLKSALIMQGESTSARASSLASDWYHLGRLRSLRELSDAIDDVTVDDVLAYLRDCPPKDFTFLFIGPEAPDVSGI